MKPFYITTSIPYPNGNPHIGHALEYVQADFLARYYRMMDIPVYFLTGLDVHGLKIQRTAEEAGMSPADFIQEKRAVFLDLITKLELSNDEFLQTNDPKHMETAQALWRMCAEKGDIYKKNYQAWYNIKEEEFLGLVEDNPDSSVFGIDPRFIEKIDEENYFFRLSRYKDQVVNLLQGGSYKILPKSRLQELLNFVESKGLQDVSISREKSKLSWGVPVPGDDTQVMYVWFDALTNYLTPISKIVDGKIVPNSCWPASVHSIGKDISRFHALLWPGMLLSAGLEIPQELLIHGFLTSGGQKMSKSIGNVVDPLQTIAEFGSDPVRWYLLKEVNTTGDADYTDERVLQVYMADLANDFGNLVSRVWTMCQKYIDAADFNCSDSHTCEEVGQMISEVTVEYHVLVERRELNQALTRAHSLLIWCNRQIEEAKPWVMAKDPDLKDDLEFFLYQLLDVIRTANKLLSPALVSTSQKVDELLAGSLTEKSPILFPRKERS